MPSRNPMTNQNRIDIHTTKPTPKKVGSADVKIFKIKSPGITPIQANIAINPEKESTIYSNKNTNNKVTNPPIIPNLT